MRKDVGKYVLGLCVVHLCKGVQDVVLVRKNKPEWQKGKYNGVGGKIEDGETPIEAMVREFAEETGHNVKDWKLFAVLRAKGEGEKNAIVWMFRADVEYDGNDLYGGMTDTRELVECHPVDKLPDTSLSNLRWLLEMSEERCSRDWPFYVEETAPTGIVSALER